MYVCLCEVDMPNDDQGEDTNPEAMNEPNSWERVRVRIVLYLLCIIIYNTLSDTLFNICRSYMPSYMEERLILMATRQLPKQLTRSSPRVSMALQSIWKPPSGAG